MVTVTIKLKLVFLFIKYAVLDKGSTKDVFVNAKNYCPRAAMRAYFVKSDIQCTHRCLRKKCKLLNYKKKAKDIENCEIFSDIGDCSVIPDQEGWKAMIFEIDVCSSAPCKNGATCSNFGDTYECKCSPGYQGTNCDQENIAYQKPSQNSSLHSYDGSNLYAYFGNDGNRNGDWELCAWTKSSPTPSWWRVDLEREASVKYIIIRSGATFEPLEINPFNIAVGNDGSNGSVNNPKCVDSGSVLSGEIKRFDCPTVMQGRYVTVYITRAVYLQVFELEVYE